MSERTTKQRSSTSVSPSFAATIVLVFIVYPMSAGPAVWIATNLGATQETTEKILTMGYLPVLWVIGNSPEPLREAFVWYLNIFSATPF